MSPRVPYPASGWGGRFEKFPESKPLPVENGLKASSTRGAIGTSWWSRRFVDALESIAVGGRLDRGRNYARRGQVLSLELTTGLVTAQVQGSRPKPYAVEIRVAPFPALLWATVEISLATQAIYCAQLLAGEMPPDIDEVFAAAGAPLFPTEAADLRMSCSCPDWEVPCKHLAAVIYLLGERFDADPFQILTWRGRDRRALLTRLRELRELDGDAPGSNVPGGAVAGSDLAGGNAAPSGPDQVAVLGTATALEGVTLSSDLTDPTRFWISSLPLPVPPTPSRIPVPADLLLRQLPVPATALGAADLVAQLRQAYERLSESE